MQIGSLYRQVMKPEDGQDSLNRPQFYALMILKSRSVTVKEFARLMGTSSSAATQMVNHLEAAGLIERLTDNNDRRQTVLRLAAEGAGRLAALKRKRLEQLQSLMRDITDDELEELVNITGKLTANK